MNYQVVRLSFENDRLWPRTARDETVKLNHDSDVAAEEIKKAIRRKERKIPPGQRGSITLVIDSIETPALLLADAPSKFLAIQGDWAKSVGFAAIWLVGPTSSLTVRLA